jgi:hypothetical protein
MARSGKYEFFYHYETGDLSGIPGSGYLVVLNDNDDADREAVVQINQKEPVYQIVDLKVRGTKSHGPLETRSCIGYGVEQGEIIPFGNKPAAIEVASRINIAADIIRRS